MKLYSKYKKVLEKIGKLEKAYFTTFNMDIEFVERYILPPLLNVEVAENKFDLEDLNTVLMEKGKPDIKFFHDANMLTSHNKSTLVEMYPILQKGGVFHPKVIYLQGDKATYLIVGSGNLTLSGWGRNIEAFQIVKIDNDNFHNQVLDFFDDVFILGGLKERKRRKDINFNSKINFIHSFKNQESSILLENLDIKDSLQIYSPYFSKDLDGLFDKKEFEEVEKINIVPDLIENQKIRLERLPKDERIKFYRFKKEAISEENADSTNHSKIWISKTKYAIGSYNCTKQALYGSNFEASLVSTYDRKEEFEINKLDEVKKPEVTCENEGIEGEKEERKRFTSLYRIVADYKKYKFEFEDISENIDIKTIKILLPAFQKKITLKEFEKVSMPQTIDIFSALVKNKIFDIYDSSDKLIYRGLIIEKNATDKTRFINSAETLNDVFISFLDERNPTEGTNLKDRSNDITSEDEAIYKRKKQKSHENYFTMFTGFKNLNKRYEEIKDDPKKLKRFCYTSATSLEVTKTILLKNLEEKSLFLYLTIEELNKLIRRANRKLPKDEKMKKLENINIKLSKHDKVFIEVMK
jgi:hypothetical protein